MQQTDKKQISPQQRNCLLHQCFFWIYHLTIISLGFAIFSQLIISYQLSQSISQSSQMTHAQQTVSLWQKGYIIDIKSVNTNNCPQGYQPLLTYNWTGTTEGCYCRTSVGNYSVEYVLNGLCTSELINENCQQVKAMTAQQLHMWKGGKLVCLKRAEALNYYDSTQTQTIDGIALTKCSQGKKYQVNILPNITCPITQVSNSSLSSSATVLQLDSLNQKLTYIKQSTYPIADFKVTEYSFCLYLSQVNISPNKIGNYKLLINTYQSCIGQDPRYQQFDSLTEEEFYTNNTRVYTKITQLPGYPRPSTNYVFKLGYVKYPEWTYQCRVSASHNLNAATERLLFTKEQNSVKTMLYIGLPCIAVFALLFRIFFCIRHIIQLRTKMLYNAVFLTDDQIVEQLPNLNIRHSKPKELFIFFIEQLLRIAVIVFVLVSLLKLLDTSVWIKDMFRFGCTQPFVDRLFLFYQQKVDSISQILVKVCFIWSVMWIIDIIWLIVRFKYIDLSHKGQSNLQSSSIHSSQQPDLAKLKDIQYPEDSSDVILQKDRSHKVKNLDDYMVDDALFSSGETKDNFYGEIESSDHNLMNATKKKKKKTVKRKKNLFKEDK